MIQAEHPHTGGAWSRAGIYCRAQQCRITMSLFFYKSTVPEESNKQHNRHSRGQLWLLTLRNGSTQHKTLPQRCTAGAGYSSRNMRTSVLNTDSRCVKRSRLEASRVLHEHNNRLSATYPHSSMGSLKTKLYKRVGRPCASRNNHWRSQAEVH